MCNQYLEASQRIGGLMCIAFSSLFACSEDNFLFQSINRILANFDCFVPQILKSFNEYFPCAKHKYKAKVA